MSTATVTPPMRAYGWNVHFLASPSRFNFAGIFQPGGGQAVTFTEVLAEMHLCFDMNPIQIRRSDVATSDADEFAFFFDNPMQFTDTPAIAIPAFVSREDLNLQVPAPPPSLEEQGEQSVLRFHLVRHTPCELPRNTSLASHLQAGCARHIPRPSRRRDPRYLPPKKSSADPRFARLPLRRTMRSRGGSQSPSKKRSASGSTSPRKDVAADAVPNEEDSVASLVAPPDLDIAADVARQTINTFRSSCLVASRRCAVTGKGKSWCVSPAVGPSLQACHIVPQQHYHVYPDMDNDPSELDSYSPRRLREAWQRTWSPQNGILLLSHLHELFDDRLFSIHPDTLRVRAFVPYDVILDYHGTVARVPASVDRAALRHHYDMCCVENMAANLPLLEPFSSPSTGISSPGSSTIEHRVNLQSLSNSRISVAPGDGVASGTERDQGDPAKRQQSTRGGMDDFERDGSIGLDDENPNEHSADETQQNRDIPYLPQKRKVSPEDTTVVAQSIPENKRSRTDASSDELVALNLGIGSPTHTEEFVGDNYGKRSATWNNDEFFADLHWELKKLQRHC